MISANILLYESRRSPSPAAEAATSPTEGLQERVECQSKFDAEAPLSRIQINKSLFCVDVDSRIVNTHIGKAR